MKKIRTAEQLKKQIFKLKLPGNSSEGDPYKPYDPIDESPKYDWYRSSTGKSVGARVNDINRGPNVKVNIKNQGVSSKELPIGALFIDKKKKRLIPGDKNSKLKIKSSKA